MVPSWCPHPGLPTQRRSRHAPKTPLCMFCNAGLDSAELVSQLRAAHAEEDTKMGVDVVLGQTGDMSKLGIYESFRVGSFFVLAASQSPWCCV